MLPALMAAAHSRKTNSECLFHRNPRHEEGDNLPLYELASFSPTIDKPTAVKGSLCSYFQYILWD